MSADLVIIEAGKQDLPEFAEQINAAVKSAESSAKNAVACALQAGALLTQAKSLVTHGQWEAWLASHCEVAPRTAQAYMRLAKSIPLMDESKAQRVADLPLREAIKAIATDPIPPTRRTYARLARQDDRERAVKALHKSAAALKSAAKLIGYAMPLKGEQMSGMKRKLTDAIAAIERMEANCEVWP